MSLCDQQDNVAGVASCHYWAAFPIEISLQASEENIGQVTVKIVEEISGLTGRGSNPVTFPVAISPFNNNAGRELRGYGLVSTRAEGKLIQVIAHETLENELVTFDFYYDSKKIFSGILRKEGL